MPFSSILIFSAAGTFGSPGIVIILPVLITAKPAPFEIVSSLTVIAKSLGAPSFVGSSESDYCVFATHMGRLSPPSAATSLIAFSAAVV